MVRIVNGEIVEEKTKVITPSAPKRCRQAILPSSRSFLGGFSYSIPFLNYEFDLFWLLVLFLIGYTRGGLNLFLLLFVLILFRSISSKYHSSKSHIATLHG